MHRHGCLALRCTERGFTLVELLVTLAVALLLGTLAVDTFPRMLAESRMVCEVNHFITALHLARSTAVLQERNVVLCPSHDLARCGTSRNWPAGWLLFASEDRERDPDEPLLQAGNPLKSGIGMSTGNARKRIVFRPDGSSGGSNASFTFCQRRHLARPRVICLSGSGRPRLAYTTCSGRHPIACP